MHPKQSTAALGALLIALVSGSAEAQSQNERQILIDLYQATEGDNWHHSFGWGTSEPLCNWSGVSCRHGLVSEIRLPGNNLSGSLPASLFSLEGLRTLDLGNNALSGSIPMVAINDLPQFTQDASVWINLANNQFSGSLPEFTAGTGPGSGVVFSFSGNQLTGRIPASWANMSIDTIELSDNPLGGTLQEVFASAPIARRLDLENTGLKGSFPEVAPASALLDRLRELNLSFNQITGSLPQWLAESGLTRLELSQNDLEGDIAFAVDAMIQNQSEYVHLYLDENAFRGPMPNSLMALHLLPSNITHVSEAALSGNRFSDLPGLNLCWNQFDEPDAELAEFIDQHHFGGSYQGCQSERNSVTSKMSGSWYDPDRSGEGFVQHRLDNGDILMFWFTYPLSGSILIDDAQAWFFRVAQPQEASVAYRGLNRTTGRFGVGGSAYLNADFQVRSSQLATGLQQASFSRAFGSGGGIGIYTFSITSQQHEQQPLTRLAGTSCNNQQPHQWISGAWYDPARSGEGFVVDVNQDGRVVIYWFTYEPNDSGHQAWMVGTGEFVDGQVVIDEMIQPIGTQFGADFDSAEIEHIDWGSLTLTFDDDDSGQIAYESRLPEYGSGSYPIERLARPMLADCD